MENVENNIFYVWIFCAALVALLFAAAVWINSLRITDKFQQEEIKELKKMRSELYSEKTKLKSRIDFLLKLCPDEMRKKYHDHFNPFKK